jgi:DMSO/TMAO reductase YedYZ molybdopterin-dependent catalytic subunit
LVGKQSGRIDRNEVQGTDLIFDQTNERKALQEQRRKEGRLPPGQSLTLKWPVLQYGDVPRVDLRTWDFRIDGLVEKPVRLSWEEFNKLPRAEIHCDIHCVTRWSRFDNRFAGVPFTEVMKLVTPKSEAQFAMVRAEHGFTANLPLVDLMKPTTIFAFSHDGEPLSAEHGYPLRLVVPHLYFWKSVKWVRGFALAAEDAPGFWEQNGYHMYGDPWKEQRYDSDQ